eukprot:CAMPEP_0114511132 /NCGR_PEP_ID=MMETSP0109-20121206/14185_1 /TAXON_ID=29199 /ORGANISM="Chlorarachnion reptans, Strain CCCM449" /LENGTH=68 /DNA_ID=CAMNT_0001690541 /DNA_START=359 /DNA_END=565 /DNA_ORIENTATION=-
MTPNRWKRRFELEAKECRDPENKGKDFVQLRPVRDEHYSKNLKWERELLKELMSGAHLQTYKLVTETS